MNDLQEVGAPTERRGSHVGRVWDGLREGAWGWWGRQGFLGVLGAEEVGQRALLCPHVVGDGSRPPGGGRRAQRRRTGRLLLLRDRRRGHPLSL